MRIKNVSASRFKGRTFSFEFGPCNLIVGPNFSGKTAIFEAIKKAFIGYLPELGKRESAALEGEVRVEFDNGSFIRRTADGGTDTDLTLGQINALASMPLANTGEYFGLTEAAGIKYIFDRIKLGAEDTTAGLLAEMERLSLGEDHSELVETAKSEIIAAVRKKATGPLQEAMDATALELRGIYAYWNSRQKETAGATRVLTELKNREGEASPDRLEALEQELVKHQTTIEEMGRTLAGGQEKHKTAQRRLTEIDRLTFEIARGDEESITRARRIEDLRAPLAAGITDARKEFKELTDELRDVDREQAQIEAQLTLTDDAIKDVTKQLAKLDDKGKCPTCKQEIDAAMSAKLRLKYRKDLDRSEESLARIKGQLAVTRGRQKELTARGEVLHKAATNAEAIRSEQAAARTLFVTLQAQREELESLTTTEPGDDAGLTPAAVANIEAALEIEKGRRSEAQIKHKAAVGLQQDLKRAAEAQLEHLAAKAHFAVAKALGTLIAAKREEVINRVLGKFLKDAGAITEAVLLTPLALHKNTIGRWEGADFISHKRFSGVETDLAHVAIAAALSASSPARILLFDELGRMTPKVQAVVMERLAGAVKSGLIDQVIAVKPADAYGEKPIVKSFKEFMSRQTPEIL